jgi:hypothetical protein
LQVDNLRQHIAGLEHEHSMERNHQLATIQELQGQVAHLQAHPPQQEGPKLHALQRELAILEEANQKLQADLRKKEDELMRMSGGNRGMGPGKLGDDLQGKEADLRRANVIIDIKTQELARLKQEMDMSEAKQREAVAVAMRVRVLRAAQTCPARDTVPDGLPQPDAPAVLHLPCMHSQ